MTGIVGGQGVHGVSMGEKVGMTCAVATSDGGGRCQARVSRTPAPPENGILRLSRTKSSEDDCAPHHRLRSLPFSSPRRSSRWRGAAAVVPGRARWCGSGRPVVVFRRLAATQPGNSIPWRCAHRAVPQPSAGARSYTTLLQGAAPPRPPTRLPEDPEKGTQLFSSTATTRPTRWRSSNLRWSSSVPIPR